MMADNELIEKEYNNESEDIQNENVQNDNQQQIEKLKDVKGIKISKKGTAYVQNDAFYEEMLKSIKQGQLTPTALQMIVLICENVNKKMVYKNPEDKKDCISGSVMDCIMYWERFDPSKTHNPFAYFTSVATNGAAKMWRALGKKKFPDSIMTSLDNENIHSL